MLTEKVSELDGVQKTLLLPLWGRAQETLSKEPLLHDPVAVSIAQNIPRGLSLMFEGLSRVTRESWIARSVYFDEKAIEFLSRHPTGTIVDVGCGLDTTFERVDNGFVRWFDLDLPSVIALRSQYLQESDRRCFISGSVLDTAWLSEVAAHGPVLLIMAGVIYYFTPAEIQFLFTRLSDQFENTEIAFDYCSDTGLRIANKRVLEETDMTESARLKWSTNDIHEIQSWNPGLRIIESIPMFRKHRRHLPFYRRIGLLVSDLMGIMSLACIELAACSGA
jgi:O-methyltransferase involved in polyketide biosynthesis